MSYSRTEICISVILICRKSLTAWAVKQFRRVEEGVIVNAHFEAVRLNVEDDVPQ